MPPNKLLTTLYGRGARVTTDGQQLHVTPASVIGDLRDAIKQHKAALIALLTPRPAPARELVCFDAGAAYRAFQASPPDPDSFWDETPPSLLEHPGMDITPAGIWVTPDGYTVATPGTMPAIRKQRENAQRQKVGV